MLSEDEENALLDTLEQLIALAEDDFSNEEIDELIKQIGSIVYSSYSLIPTAKREYELVKEFIDDNPTICIYCGSKATERDHLLPLPWTGKAARLNVPTVPACRNCNSTLGDFPSPFIFERCQLIADSIEDSRYTTLRAGGAANVGC